MLKPEQVPDEVWTQVALRLESAGALVSDRVARLVAAEVINAWPGMKLENLCGWVMDGPDLPYVEEAASIILPLPQEASDDKA